MQSFSWVEKALLIVLLAASGALSGVRLRKVKDAIRRARPTPDFEIFPVWWRVRRFLLEVVGQTKVIRQRPLPGLAHAFVLWGFCAFAPITVNHIAAGFGAGFLNRAGAFGHFYVGFVAVWLPWRRSRSPDFSCTDSSSAPCGWDRYRRNPASSPG